MWKSSGRIEKAVKNQDEPDHTFELYEVSRVMYRSNSYLKVLQKIKIAGDQSDLQKSWCKKGKENQTVAMRTFHHQVNSHSISAFEKKLLTILEEVKGQVTQNTKLINNLIKKEDKPTDGNDIPEGIHLPVSTREDFEALDERIQNENTGKKLINHLGTACGENVTECTRRTLKYSITNQLAMGFN
ncbi:unnamed protein product [Mytilus coruscus]|uniref:Uncharacterized protein n=1 Tax=Mytilus coruscus TaxID=42192 RepID=A0A6J8CNC7_MYTCO|nr:unnamed protein product [Mytilus coruscus]